MGEREIEARGAGMMGMMMMRGVVKEVVVCLGMVIVEGSSVGLTIMVSTVMSRGMSPFVFVFYTNALSSIILLPYSFFFFRDRSEQQLFTLPFLIRIFFLGLTGTTIAQNLAFVGLSYSSPILACGMGNLIPAFSFMLSIILRTTRFDWKSSGSQAKVIGTLISIMGAISVTLYKGPVISKHSYSSLSHEQLLQLPPPLFLFSSTNEHWVLGGIFLAAGSFFLSIWNIIQMGTIKEYPEVMTIVSIYSLVGTIQTAVVSIIIERDPNAWRLKLNMELLVVVLTAIFGSVIRIRAQMWCMRWKGPFYVSMFKPLGIPIASACGCIFFANNFHYGSMMGAIIVGMGYYTVMWGQIREDETNENFGDGSASSSDEKLPLLQHESQV